VTSKKCIFSSGYEPHGLSISIYMDRNQSNFYSLMATFTVYVMVYYNAKSLLPKVELAATAKVLQKTIAFPRCQLML